MTNTNRNEYAASEKLNVPGLQQAMQQLKEETAAEFGLVGYENMDKGELTSRQNGTVGGNITKKLVALAQSNLANRS